MNLCSLWLRKLWKINTHTPSTRGTAFHQPPPDHRSHTPMSIIGRCVVRRTAMPSVQYLTQAGQIKTHANLNIYLLNFTFTQKYLNLDRVKKYNYKTF